jgi:hypothetical protein
MQLFERGNKRTESRKSSTKYVVYCRNSARLPVSLICSRVFSGAEQTTRVNVVGIYTLKVEVYSLFS